MPFKQPPELHELQSDVLGVSLIDNPHLPGSPIPSKNKALKTSKPYVTGAINELLQTIENIRNLAQTSLSQQQAVLGDFVSDSTLISNLQKIDSSVLKAIIKLSKEIEGDINDPQDISAIAPSIKEAILKLAAGQAEAEQKVVTFVFTAIPQGVAAPICKFPFSGTIAQIDAYALTSAAQAISFDLQTISQADFEAGRDNWQSILGENLVIPANANILGNSPQIKLREVGKNNIFRAEFASSGQDQELAQDLTVQIVIEI
ncbi:MAG: hypothetical protein LBR56_03305 [Sporomusaceae bacterium]|jgi:hypothetical protein|nr:hypothetical protein [Sporomusaceae bacterium]